MPWFFFRYRTRSRSRSRSPGRRRRSASRSPTRRRRSPSRSPGHRRNSELHHKRSNEHSRSYSKERRSSSRTRDTHARFNPTPYYRGTNYRGTNYRGEKGSSRHQQPFHFSRDQEIAVRDKNPVVKDDQRNLWTKLEQELVKLEQSLQQQRDYYATRPEDHPQYAFEWKLFYQRRFIELQNEGKDAKAHGYTAEWKLFWQKRVNQLDEGNIQAKKNELKIKYQLMEDEIVEGPKRGASTALTRKSSRKEDARDPVQFGWNNKLVETTPNILTNSSSEKVESGKMEIRKLPPLKSIYMDEKQIKEVHSQPKGSFIKSFEPTAGSSSKIDVDLLCVLRSLAAVEDQLGKFNLTTDIYS